MEKLDSVFSSLFVAVTDDRRSERMKVKMFGKTFSPVIFPVLTPGVGWYLLSCKVTLSSVSHGTAIKCWQGYRVINGEQWSGPRRAYWQQPTATAVITGSPYQEAQQGERGRCRSDEPFNETSEFQLWETESHRLYWLGHHLCFSSGSNPKQKTSKSNLQRNPSSTNLDGARALLIPPQVDGCETSANLWFRVATSQRGATECVGYSP